MREPTHIHFAMGDMILVEEQSQISILVYMRYSIAVTASPTSVPICTH